MIVARTCAIYHYRSWITDWHSHPTRWFYFTVKVVQFFRAVGSNGASYTKVMDNPLINVHRDMELVAKPILIRTFNNPAEIVRVCESEVGKVFPVLRNGVDEIYVMDYEAYRMREDYLVNLLKSEINRKE
ncbi:hypothetical protein ACTNEF_02750 [Bariatricus sp. HCP28S3_E4]|uniref:hypothetical protein n=2 Tax=Bariatricus TaxID=1924081 RepID=UPI003F88D32C